MYKLKSLLTEDKFYSFYLISGPIMLLLSHTKFSFDTKKLTESMLPLTLNKANILLKIQTRSTTLTSRSPARTAQEEAMSERRAWVHRGSGARGGTEARGHGAPRYGISRVSPWPSCSHLRAESSSQTIALET